MKRRDLRVLAAIIVLGAGAGSALAGPYDWLHRGTTDELAVKVNYRDLDLSRPEGVRALERRVAQAAIRACEEDAAPVEIRLDSRACQREAIAAGRDMIAQARGQAERNRAFAKAE
jgi:UrcA family protein